MANFTNPYRANEFVVEIGGVESPTVSKVSGLSLGETDTVEVIEGGTNVVHKVSSGVVKFQSLTIERYMDGSEDDALFKAFFEEMFKLNQGGKAPMPAAMARSSKNNLVRRFSDWVFMALGLSQPPSPI